MTSLSETLMVIKTHLANVEVEVNDLENKSRKTSAPRARKSIQDAKNLLLQLRKDISTHVKAIPVKKRVTKETPEPEPLPLPVPEPEPVPVPTPPVKTKSIVAVVKGKMSKAKPVRQPRPYKKIP